MKRTWNGNAVSCLGLVTLPLENVELLGVVHTIQRSMIVGGILR